LQGNDILMALYLRQLCAYAIADSSGVSYDQASQLIKAESGDGDMLQRKGKRQQSDDVKEQLAYDIIYVVIHRKMAGHCSFDR
jgi:hypothetical protein